MDSLTHFLDPSLSTVLVLVALLVFFLKRWLQPTNFYILVISSLIAFVTGEGFSRLMRIGNPEVVNWKEDRVENKDYFYRPNSQLLYTYPDNPRGYFDNQNRVWGSINAKGFRGVERDFEKDPESVRLAFLGDSFTLGIGVKDEDTLPSKVELELQGVHEKAEVLNFGVSGFDTRDEIELLENYVLKFKPDVVVIVTFLNDVGRIPTVGFLSRPKFLSSVRRYSHFTNALIGAIEKPILSYKMIRHYRDGYLDGSPGYESLKTSLRRGKRLSEQHRFALVVALYPVLFQLDDRYPFKEVHNKIATFCGQEKIFFIDLFDALRGKSDMEMWVHSTDQHPNEVAHQLAARQLAQYLVKQRLIPALLSH